MVEMILRGERLIMDLTMFLRTEIYYVDMDYYKMDIEGIRTYSLTTPNLAYSFREGLK